MRPLPLCVPACPAHPPLPPPRRPSALSAVPGDNSVDLFTNDLGLVVITDPATGKLEGFNLVAGGGMGEQSRGRAERLRVQLREL